MTRNAIGLVVTALLGGCGDDGDAGGGVPDPTTPSRTFTFASEADVRLGWHAVDLPYLVAFGIAPDPSVGGSCPAVTLSERGDRYTAVGGGCTDRLGTTWRGRVDGTIAASAGQVSYRFDFQGLEALAATGARVKATGVLEADLRPSATGLPAPELRAQALVLELEGAVDTRYGAAFPGGPLRLRYSAYAYAWDGRIPAGFRARGVVEVEGRGDFGWDLGWSLEEGCRLPSTGALVFTGADEARLIGQGGACPDCLDLEAGGEGVGTLCWAP